jgi:hypothetical protein
MTSTIQNLNVTGILNADNINLASDVLGNLKAGTNALKDTTGANNTAIETNAL